MSTCEFKTTKGEQVTVVFSNRLREMIKHRVWFESYGKGHPDEDLRLGFCWFAAHVSEIDGTDWRPPAQNCSEKQFSASYFAFSDLVDFTTFKMLSDQVDAMKTRNNKMQKPDDSLTESEKMDPN